MGSSGMSSRPAATRSPAPLAAGGVLRRGRPPGRGGPGRRPGSRPDRGRPGPADRRRRHDLGQLRGPVPGRRPPAPRSTRSRTSRTGCSPRPRPAARRVLRGMSLEEIMGSRDEIGEELLRQVRESAAAYGLEVTGLDFKDLIIPDELREALNRAVLARRLRQAEPRPRSGSRRPSSEDEADVHARPRPTATDRRGARARPGPSLDRDPRRPRPGLDGRARGRDRALHAPRPGLAGRGRSGLARGANARRPEATADRSGAIRSRFFDNAAPCPTVDSGAPGWARRSTHPGSGTMGPPVRTVCVACLQSLEVSSGEEPTAQADLPLLRGRGRARPGSARDADHRRRLRLAASSDIPTR